YSLHADRKRERTGGRDTIPRRGYVKGPRAGPGPLGPRAPGILPPLPPPLDGPVRKTNQRADCMHWDYQTCDSRNKTILQLSPAAEKKQKCTGPAEPRLSDNNQHFRMRSCSSPLTFTALRLSFDQRQTELLTLLGTGSVLLVRKKTEGITGDSMSRRANNTRTNMADKHSHSRTETETQSETLTQTEIPTRPEIQTQTHNKNPPGGLSAAQQGGSTFETAGGQVPGRSSECVSVERLGTGAHPLTAKSVWPPSLAALIPPSGLVEGGKERAALRKSETRSPWHVTPTDGSNRRPRGFDCRMFRAQPWPPHRLPENVD
ncbi:unnamed protein product, partial [Nesidiocoris tenuis]